jgi:hypothetical protein
MRRKLQIQTIIRVTTGVTEVSAPRKKVTIKIILFG